MVGGQQLPSLVRGQAFDAERARQRHECRVEAILGRLCGPQVDVVGGRIDLAVVGLAGELEDPAVHPRRPAARAQRLDQPGRPQALVHVDRRRRRAELESSGVGIARASGVAPPRRLPRARRSSGLGIADATDPTTHPL